MIPVAGMLDIEVIPIEFEVIKTDPKLEVVSHTPGRFEVTRSGGEYTPVKRSNFDKSSFSKPRSFSTSNGKVNFDGRVGNDELKNRVDQILSDVHRASALSMQSMQSFDQMMFEYTPETIEFNWIREEKIMKGTPGSIERIITQYPGINITYLGGPIYVPPSSDPNYVEPEEAV